MNHISQHIEYLILNHDCVILPGFGAFIATTSPAVIDMERGFITSPSREIMFNRALTTDDGLLANSYKRKFSLSFEDARDIVVKEVSWLKNRLISHGEIEIGRLGKLFYESDIVRFAPSSNYFNLSSDSYPDISFKSHDAAQSPEISSDGSKGLELCVNNAGFIYSLKHHLTGIAASIIFMLLLAATIICHPTPYDSREEKASVVPVGALFADTRNVIEEVADKGNMVADKETGATSEEKIIEEEKYYLIVATFSSEKEAQMYVELNSDSGYDLEIIPGKRVCRVSVSNSTDRQKIQKQLNSLSAEEKFSNSWIWQK